MLTGFIETACNSKGVLQRLQCMLQDVRLAHHKEAESDFLMTYKLWSNRSFLKRRSWWDKGHTMPCDQVSLLAQLNIWMDQAAAKAYCLPSPWISVSTQPALPDKRWAVFAKGKSDYTPQANSSTPLPQTSNRTIRPQEICTLWGILWKNTLEGDRECFEAAS